MPQKAIKMFNATSIIGVGKSNEMFTTEDIYFFTLSIKVKEKNTYLEQKEIFLLK